MITDEEFELFRAGLDQTPGSGVTDLPSKSAICALPKGVNAQREPLKKPSGPITRRAFLLGVAYVSEAL